MAQPTARIEPSTTGGWNVISPTPLPYIGYHHPEGYSYGFITEDIAQGVADEVNATL